MKVLFIASGNSGKLNPLIKAQFDSLVKYGLNVEYELIKGRGLIGYLFNIPKIRRKVISGKFDLVHAHFFYSAIVATFASQKGLVVSLMGSDLKKNNLNKYLIRFFLSFFWKNTIVKSKEMFDILNNKKVQIVPNGVDFTLFKPNIKLNAQEKLNWDSRKKHVLFAANPSLKVKNYSLAKSAFDLLDQNNYEIHFLVNIEHDDAPYYFNAADVVVLTSLWEGSPNVIKEALACNRPIVCTDCGDVKELLNDVKGCFISSYSADEIHQKILMAIDFEASDGRSKIEHLESRIIAKKISEIYNSSFLK